MDTCTWFLFLAGVGDMWVSEGGVWEVWACCTNTLTDLSALCPQCGGSRWTHSHAHTCTLSPCLRFLAPPRALGPHPVQVPSTRVRDLQGTTVSCLVYPTLELLKPNSLWKIGSLVSLVPLMIHCQMLTFLGGYSIHLDDLFLFFAPSLFGYFKDLYLSNNFSELSAT